MKVIATKKEVILKTLCGNSHMTRMEVFEQSSKNMSSEIDWSTFKRVFDMLVHDGMITTIRPRFADHIATTYILSEKGRKEC